MADVPNGLAERYQELSDDFYDRWLIALRNLTANSVIAGSLPVAGYLVQEQLTNPAHKFAVVVGTLAVAGTRLRSAYISVDHEGLLNAEYHHFKDLSLSQANESFRSE